MHWTIRNFMHHRTHYGLSRSLIQLRDDWRRIGEDKARRVIGAIDRAVGSPFERTVLCDVLARLGSDGVCEYLSGAPPENLGQAITMLVGELEDSAKRRSEGQTREFLIRLVNSLPADRKRVIMGEQGSYLTRYTLATSKEASWNLPRAEDGGAVYLHFFHRSDADDQLHNHPWTGRSLILTGGYREERRVGDQVLQRYLRPCDVNILYPDTFHRIDLTDPAAGCWTLFLAGERVQSWGFWDRHTHVFTPYREALAARGLLATTPANDNSTPTPRPAS